MAQKSKRNFCTSSSKVLSRLTEIFPAIPVDLFEPFLEYNESQLTELIINLIYKEDNSDQMEYLLHLTKEYQNKGINKSSDYKNKHYRKSYEDELLDSSRRCFSKDIHKFLDSRLELENENYEDNYPKVTEKNWKLPENCSQSQLGLIDSNQELKIPKTIYKTPEKDVPSLREVMDSEEAIQNSIKNEKNKIKDCKELSNKIDILQSLYPQISREELENKFIYYDMDVELTNYELSRIGFSSTGFPNETYCASSTETEANIKKFEPEYQQQKIHEIKNRIELEQEVIGDLKHQLSIRGCNQKVKSGLKEELYLSIDRLHRLEEEFALKSSAQQSAVSGNLNLDLHGFTCQAALTVVDERLSEVCSSETNMEKERYITIICGRGLHSSDRKARLKPVIEQYLKGKRITYFETFEGTFRIYLKQFF